MAKWMAAMALEVTPRGLAVIDQEIIQASAGRLCIKNSGMSKSVLGIHR
jgi:hypothetical protein